MGVYVADDLAGDDAGFIRISRGGSDIFEHCFSGGLDFALVVAVDFHEAVEAFDDLDAGADDGGLEGDVHHAIDFDAGGDFQPQRCISRQGEETLGFDA
jgi:hypothetical protein